MMAAIRPATSDDAGPICDIHNQGIADRLATLETVLRTPDGTRAWLAERRPRYPVIVADLDGVVVGWASLNQFNPRAAYDRVADFSVYVARDRRGRGIGAQLLDSLVSRARTIGFHKMVLAALARNEAGIALYVRAGFTHVGIYREHGQLDGRWVDVVIMEKLL
ncbi:MAG TPA: arsinothricin resistance N-acetyltransferase ArsN1 family A [Vicinamibacterales bacterium]|nr:arsinothricin resistance N-acetyltransferase ArsN1 family A [Vicinamibacterales bacterium]